MNKTTTVKNTLTVLIAVLSIILSMGIALGIDFIIPSVNFEEQIRTARYWINFGILNGSLIVIFFAMSILSRLKRLKNDEEYHEKKKDIRKVISLTGLEKVEFFLDEYYLDKKHERQLNIYRNRIEKIKAIADKKSYNILGTVENNQFKNDKEEKEFKKLLYKYNLLKEMIDNPNLRNDLRYTYIPGVYRVSRSYISDGVRKYEEFKDNDKPEDGFKYNLKTITFRLLWSVALGAILTSILFEVNITKELDVAFLIFALSRAILFLMNMLSGKLQGDSYFESIILDFEIKREFVLQKYLLWLKKNHPEIWNSLGSKQTLEKEIIKNETN